MNGVAELLDSECIKLDLEARRKSDALRELVELLHREGKIEDPEAAQAGLIEREKLASTGIGRGIAIPHLLSEEARETVMAFGRKREGIRFDAIDGRPVTLVFLIVGPKHREYAHLRLLSRLARLLQEDSFRQALLQAQSASEVLEIVRGKEAKEEQR